MALTRDQIKQNIDAMQQQGASDNDIQGYLNALKKPVEPQGNTGLKGFATGLAKKEVGLLKGAGSLVQGLGQRIIAAGTPASLEEVRAKTGIKSLQKGTEQEYRFQEAITPRGTSEKVGSFVGDVASFALPGGAITRVGKAVGAATKTGFLGRAATEAVGFSGITAAQEGEINNDVKDAAIIASLFPVLGKVNSTIKALTEGTRVKIKSDIANKLVTSLIKPKLRDFSYGKNPGLGVAKEGITGNSLEELAQNISKKRQSLFRQTENIAKKSNKTVNLSNVLLPIDNAIIKAQKTPKTNATLISRLEDIKSDLLGGIDNFNNVSVEEAVNFKRTIGDITKFTGNISDDTIVNKPLKQIYGSVKEKINAVESKLKGLNERYANLTSAEIATKNRDLIEQRQNIIGLTTGGLGTGAALVTAITTGGAAIPAILVGAGAVATREALGTPAVKTRIASYLANATTKEKRELIKEAPWMKGIILETFLGISE